MARKLFKVSLAIVAICAPLVFLKLLRDRSGYTLTLYKKQGENAMVSLRNGGHTIQAECSGPCEEFGTMVGQHLFCFTEPAPSDESHPYATKRPIFKNFGGSFVCRLDGGTGRLFLTRKYKCLQEASLSDHEKQLRNEFPEDALYVSPTDLDKLYCKAGEMLIDQGGDIVTEDGQVLPSIAKRQSVELKVIEMR
jgi:hypothetical protein